MILKESAMKLWTPACTRYDTFTKLSLACSTTQSYTRLSFNVLFFIFRREVEII